MKKFWWWVFILLWCGFIFFQSSKPAVESSKESTFVLTAINSGVRALTGLKDSAVTEHFIRKSGHFIEYFILGILLSKGISGRSKKKTLVLVTVLGALYASTDELHQLFVPGRSAEIKDVGLDTLGLFLAALLIYFNAKRKFNGRYA